jgi:hypothetical protein
VGFVVDIVGLGQDFSEYFGFPTNLHSTKFLVLTITRDWYNRPEVADMPSGSSLDSILPLHVFKKEKYSGS